MQLEIESSLADILSILQQGVSGPEASKQASFLRKRLFSLTPSERQRATLDPRVVSCILSIQGLISELGAEALSSVEWTEFTNYLLRLQVFCNLAAKETGSLSVANNNDDWISIPGTSFYLPAETPTKVVHFCRGELTNKDVINTRVEGEKCDTKIALAIPENHFKPPISGKSLVELTPDERKSWTESIIEALRLISLDAPSTAIINEYAWFLVPLQSEQTGYFSSISFNNLPNAIFMTLHSDLMFAETLVHEADHQWLYSYSRSGSLWSEKEHEQRAVYRSPWREDPRPLDGILRGASAFVRVGSFWTALAHELPENHPNHKWIRARATLSNFQAIDALQTAIKFGDLSNLGEQFVSELFHSARGTRTQLSTLPDFAELLESARAEQHEHDEQWSMCHPTLSEYCNKLLIQNYFSL